MFANFYAMNEQQISNKRKNLIWLLIPFAVIGLLIVSNLIINRLENSHNGLSGLGIMESSNLPGMISAEELADMANRFDVNYIAGECIDKGYKEYDVTFTNNDGQQITGHAYYYIKKNYASNVDEDMIERITPLILNSVIEYTIKSKKDYQAFMSYLKEKSVDTVESSKRLFMLPHYVVNNGVFIDLNYQINRKGYCIWVYSQSNYFNSAKKEIVEKKDEITNDKSAEYASKTNEYRTKLKGLWYGNYGEGNIKLAFVKFSGDSAEGCSSVKENYAQFSGSISESNSGYNIEMREPEGSRMGVFKLSYNSSENSISGIWSSYDGTLSRDMNLIRAKEGDKMKVISEKATIYYEPNISAKTEMYVIAGDEIEFLDFSEAFIKFRFTNDSGTETIGWLLIRRAIFE